MTSESFLTTAPQAVSVSQRKVEEPNLIFNKLPQAD